MGNATTSSNQESTRVEYFTDEDELAEETEWIRVKNKSKKMENEHFSHSTPTATGNLRTTTTKRKKDTSSPHR